MVAGVISLVDQVVSEVAEALAASAVVASVAAVADAGNKHKLPDTDSGSFFLFQMFNDILSNFDHPEISRMNQICAHIGNRTCLKRIKIDKIDGWITLYDIL